MNSEGSDQVSTPAYQPDASRHALNINDEGFTVIASGENPIVDIVFVHGLQGHPKNSWTFRSSDKAPNNSRDSWRIFSSFRSGADSQKPHEARNQQPDGLFWPSVLLSPDFPNARILTYGYDSHVTRFFSSSSNQNNIFAHGQTLLNNLERIRRKSEKGRPYQGDPNRPIIFIAHSLGGLILKETLRRSRHAASNQEDLRKIYDCTHGIIFMGTPHRGSKYADWGLMARMAAMSAGFDANDRILKDLKYDAEYLEMLRQEFSQMLDAKRFEVYTFQEGKGYKGVQGFNGKVVDDFSSELDHALERRDHINENHQNMCRFYGSDDPGYEMVRDSVSRLVEILTTKAAQLSQDRADGKPPPSSLAEPSLTLPDICKKHLLVNNLSARVADITSPHHFTMEWLWASFQDNGPGFLEWLQSGAGLFWIRGKPGSGKSTIMKYAFTHQRTKSELARNSPAFLLAGFFFHDRGSGIEKSLQGLFRSILYQILEYDSNFISAIWEILYPQNYLAPARAPTWSDIVLNQAFVAILESQQFKLKLCLFIDALDEYDSNLEGHANLAAYLSEAAKMPKKPGSLMICTAGRPHNVFLDAFRGVAGFAIDDWTQSDIIKYVSDKLDGHQRVAQLTETENHLKIIEQVKKAVISRASGVFLWVRLVVEELREELTQEASLNSLPKVLASLPQNLEDMFLRILKKIKHEYRQETYLMLEITRSAVTPLSPEDFVYVLQLALGLSSDELPSSIADLERWTKSRCGELIELCPIDKAEQIFNQAANYNQPLKLHTSDSGLYYDPFGSHAINPGGLRVQFLHQTVKDFAAQPDNLQFLLSKGAFMHADWNGSVWLLRANVQRMKFATKTSIWNADTWCKDSVTYEEPGEMISRVLEYAYIAEYETNKPQSESLDKYNTILCAIIDPNWPSIFAGSFGFGPTHPAPTFLCVCLAAGIRLYVLEKLKSDSTCLQSDDLHILLYYAVRGLEDHPLLKSSGAAADDDNDADDGDNDKFLFLASLLQCFPSGSLKVAHQALLSGEDYKENNVLFYLLDTSSLWKSHETEIGDLQMDRLRPIAVAPYVVWTLAFGADPNQMVHSTYISYTNEGTTEFLDEEIMDEFCDLSVLALSNQQRVKYFQQISIPLELKCSEVWYQPLHALAFLNDPDIISKLLDRGADIASRDCEARTALHISWQYELQKSAQYLLQEGAKVTIEMIKDAYDKEYEDISWWFENGLHLFSELLCDTKYWEPAALDFVRERRHQRKFSGLVSLGYFPLLDSNASSIDLSSDDDDSKRRDDDSLNHRKRATRSPDPEADQRPVKRNVIELTRK